MYNSHTHTHTSSWEPTSEGGRRNQLTRRRGQMTTGLGKLKSTHPLQRNNTNMEQKKGVLTVLVNKGKIVFMSCMFVIFCSFYRDSLLTQGCSNMQYYFYASGINNSSAVIYI